MGIEFLYRITILLISLALAALQALAQSQPKPIEDKDNPLMIGKRDNNNNQLNFYSLDKKTALGRQLAAKTDRQSKFITDKDPSDRPTLKRGEPAATESSGGSQESTGRPTLKRRSDAGADPNNES